MRKSGSMKETTAGIATVHNSAHNTASWQQLSPCPVIARLDITSVGEGHRFPTLHSSVSSTLCIAPLNSTPSPNSLTDNLHEARRAAGHECSDSGFLNKQKRKRSATALIFRDRPHFHKVTFCGASPQLQTSPE